MPQTSAERRMERIRELMRQRDELESEANILTHQLLSPGPNGQPPAGLKDPLVDQDGFPRGDIDLYEIRRQRNRLSTINTDHKNIMKEIEKELQVIYSNHAANANSEIQTNSHLEEKDQKTQSTSNGTMISHLSPPPSNSENSRTILIPFAIIDEILPNSPAQVSGLVDGDELIQFDSIDAKIQNPLSYIPQIVSKNANHPINLKIRRNGVEMSIALTPQAWSGRGLLGCHLSPVG
jgi:26S proteasome regulatory subunit N4